MSQDLIARLEAIEAQAASLRAELAKAQEPKPWARWKPEHDGTYWFVNSWGRTEETHWLDWDTDRACYNLGNVHPTPEAAERHAKRLRSMVPTCPVPKVGQKVWSPVVDDLRFVVGYSREWKGDAADRLFYNRGQVFDSPESCAEWIAEFAEAWATLEDGS